MGMKPRDVRHADPDLFLSLTEGERADALRLALEEKRLHTMAKVGRYRVISVEPLALKPPHPRSGRRLARAIFYDYASDARIEVTADLEASEVFYAASTGAQPMLSATEEANAIAIATANEDVNRRLTIGDVAQGVMHYWSRNAAEVPFKHRSAAVLFGQPGATPTLVAVVNLIDADVSEVVAAELW